MHMVSSRLVMCVCHFLHDISLHAPFVHKSVDKHLTMLFTFSLHDTCLLVTLLILLLLITLLLIIFMEVILITNKYDEVWLTEFIDQPQRRRWWCEIGCLIR